jgi:hypothetical protein
MIFVIYFLVFLIMIPISVALLIISMLISSKITGGIDFGELRDVILKSTGLLVAVNIVALLPWGDLPALVIFLAGLASLFRLGWLECLILAVVNGILNMWLESVVFAILKKAFL